MGTGRRWRYGEEIPEAVRPALARQMARLVTVGAPGRSCAVERLMLRARERGGFELNGRDAARMLDALELDPLALRAERIGRHGGTAFSRCACGVVTYGSQCMACIVRDLRDRPPLDPRMVAAMEELAEEQEKRGPWPADPDRSAP